MKSPDGKYAWTARVGDKGQIVIPKEAREIFGFTPGTTVLLLGDLERGLAVVRSEMLVDFANMILSVGRDRQDTDPDQDADDDTDTSKIQGE